MNKPADITEEELIMLNECQTPGDWSEACGKIKEERDGQYPHDWWAKVKLSGLMDSIFSRWGESSDLSVREF